ncbi:potassium channel family protein [Streptomyces alkaliphilus]|uniref:potassium channel family protein n=1 Tax=Streptomyces alkaliphilus TaxID=1472722 RepID=UPI00117CA9FB|nr:potassium channel family protein [Streptomyces alkaliphilus]MQS09814.1 two pore domain potassium channel family protein [Streptomyces alkaliphilus]
MDIIVTLLGVTLIALVTRDLFHTLWHPTRHGGMSRLAMVGLWRLSRSLPRPGRGRGPGSLVGPLGMVTVILLWGTLATLGWALLYWPNLPDLFIFDSDLDPTEHGGFLDALYMSMVALTTLGLGDVAPADGWVRLAVPIEAMFGFVLLSAVVSWVLGVYPTLGHRRQLAGRLHLLRAHDHLTGDRDQALTSSLLDDLTAAVVQTRGDFTQYPEGYWFRDADDHLSLSATIHHAHHIALRGRRSEQPDVRLSAAMLGGALDDLAAVLDRQFLRTGGTTAEVFASYAADHRRRVPQADARA